MAFIDSFISAACFVLFMAGVVFIYYLSKTSQYNEASETRAKRRMEDVAYYLSKLEEHIEDSESQLHKKIDSSELEARINLSIYDNAVTKKLQRPAKKRERMEES